MTFLGWKIYYQDGSVASSRDMTWEQSPSIGVEVVTIFFKETYQIWRDGQEFTENYCSLLHGQDYYWLVDGVPQAGNAQQVLSGTVVKVGMLLEDEQFASIYDQAKEQRVF